ncbi:hypothetical protein [Arcobacter ellisii]|uniref:Uncharacterized protein n=1 Tax=Arcobacter ellisii TaxID=913109 RepID=A0A347U4V4_9BACT|nr:hypothetical protein [Arcobacter ellisii]AXX93882.1 hypothetical protein AELL_0177 [Arcobacter ellisii]RXI33076.1 hypothetical protein CP962_01320 [Arcobacter ellisii]
MKKKFIIISTIFFIFVDFLYAENIESVLKIKPEIKYNENLKYEEINKYKENKDFEIKSNYDFGINIDINKELMTIDGIKIDVGTKF